MPRSGDIKEVFILVTLAVFAAMAFNTLSSGGIALVGQWDTSKGVVSARSKDSVVDSSREINALSDMKRIVEEKQGVVVDARSQDDYEQGHIPGAVNFPMSRFDEVIGDFFETVQPSMLVVLYCSGQECHDSHAFADQIIQFGYTDVKVFSGGFGDWANGGLPVETGAGDAG